MQRLVGLDALGARGTEADFARQLAAFFHGSRQNTSRGQERKKLAGHVGFQSYGLAVLHHDVLGVRTGMQEKLRLRRVFKTAARLSTWPSSRATCGSWKKR